MNIEVKVRGHGREALNHALSLAFANSPSSVARYSFEDSKIGLILLWDQPDFIHTYTKLHVEQIAAPPPAVSPSRSAAIFVERWLSGQRYPKQPDTDGFNEKGWRLVSQASGLEGSELYHHCAIVAVKPSWITFGK